jgi:hypothetical protein
MFNSSTKMCFSVVDYLERQEEGFHLVFLNEDGQCYALNDTGKVILSLLREGYNFEQVCDKLSQQYSIGKNELRMYVANYISQLATASIVQDSGVSEMGTEVFDIPTITPLEKVYDKSEQCQTFGMPKRSCKALPSGLNVVGKK